MSYQNRFHLTVALFFFGTFLFQSAIAKPLAQSSISASTSTVQNSPTPRSSATAASTVSPSTLLPVRTATPEVETVPSDIEMPLVDLVKALTKLVEKKSEPEKLSTTLLELLEKLGALIGTLIACYASYKASKEIPWFKENKEFIGTVAAAVALVVLFYLLSGIVTSVLYVFVAILILLVALVISAAHLLSFIDTRYPDVRDSILSRFSDSPQQKPLKKIVRDNAKNLYDFLVNIAFAQSVAGEPELTLHGSLAEGFDKSTFRFTPSENIASSWQIIDDRLLVPVGMSITLCRDDNSEEAVIVNIQLGLVVVRIGDKLELRKFNHEGFKRLGAAFVQHQMKKLQTSLEQQQAFANNVNSFNEQLP